ncbi:MAG TPA: histidine triad nucleotide-binding protein [Gemmatimonadaceae bacterium]|nr:histidine triad nucleotide-binding protein [Gemmatimonadaceae bacterium]
MADQCLFCRIVRREIPATIVEETPEYLAFRDINPQAPVHVVIVPKTHVASLSEATDPSSLGGLIGVAAGVAKREGLAEPGYRFVINTHRDGGQTVFHLHAHLLGGRHMTWPPG